jgi:hypothetical protein
MNFENSLLEFLKSGKKLDYDYDRAEPGFVGLCSHDDLKEEIIYIEGPNQGESYFEIPAVSLTNDNEYYDPEFILLWLPIEKKYGTWDCDHWDLYIFENANWKDIELNPLPYINFQWDQDKKVGVLFDPTGKYELKQGWPI